MAAKKCTKKHDACAELLFCQSQPTAFLPFSLTSPSSLLEGDVTRRFATMIFSVTQRYNYKKINIQKADLSKYK